MATQKDRDRLKELNEQLRFLLGIVPTNGSYLYQGTKYNKRGYDDLVKKTRDEIKKVEKKLAPPSASEQVASETTRRETLTNRANNLSKQYDALAVKLLDIQQALGKSKTVEEETNLRGWIATIQRNLDQINRAVVSLRQGTDVATPAVISVPSLNQAKTTPAGRVSTVQPTAPVAGAAPTVTSQQGVATTSVGESTPIPFVPGPGETPFGATLQTGTMPTGAAGTTATTTTGTTTTGTTTRPGTTTTTGTVVTGPAGTTGVSAGPTYTDPATQVTYQPGQQIGGEDRALPNGGAVVDGVYIPPGIDYAAIGATMQIPADWEKAAREMFGVWYDVFKNDPEMSAFIQRLMREPEMSDAMFLAELQKTNWWKTTNSTAREYARRQVEDPATLQLEISETTALLRAAALDRGFAVDDKSLNDAALKMVQFGFSQQTALNHLAQLTLGTATGPSSLVNGFYGQSIRELASKFGVPLSDTTLTKWTSDIATGNQTLNSFEAYARDLAKNLYPTLSSGFDRGLSFGQMTDPYAQVASRILEIPSTQVDFTDPKWAQAFTMKNEKGEQVPMSFGEWADYLRTNESFGWEYTDDAKNRAFTVVNRLAELFGAA